MRVEAGAPRVLHTALMAAYEPGVYRQMAWESLSVDGLPWEVKIFTPLSQDDPAGIFHRNAPRRRVGGKLGQWLSLRWDYYQWLRMVAPRYDVVLVRHTTYDVLRPFLLRGVHSKVGSVHHTLEESELRSYGARFLPICMYLAERFFGRASLRAVDFIVGVTPEIVEYEVCRSREGQATFVYPNGTLPRVFEPADERGAVPVILFVASQFHAWQGLDRLLESLIRVEDDFELHVVGATLEGEERCEDPRVRFHGVLDAPAIDTLVARSWVGLSSFALCRKGMREACTLKVREYLSSGLPVFSGHRDVFPESMAFYRQGCADMAEILEFAHEVRSASRQEVIDDSANLIEKRILVSRLHRELALALDGERGKL